MKQRVGDDRLGRLIPYAKKDDLAAWDEPSVRKIATHALLDLRDARDEIERLKAELNRQTIRVVRMDDAERRVLVERAVRAGYTVSGPESFKAAVARVLAEGEK